VVLPASVVSAVIADDDWSEQFNVLHKFTMETPECIMNMYHSKMDFYQADSLRSCLHHTGVIDSRAQVSAAHLSNTAVEECSIGTKVLKSTHKGQKLSVVREGSNIFTTHFRNMKIDPVAMLNFMLKCGLSDVNR